MTGMGRHRLNRITEEKQGSVCERSGMEESKANRSEAETTSLNRSLHVVKRIVEMSRR